MNAAKRPKILLFATMNWMSTARLGLALVRRGFEVATVAPAGHGIGKIESIKVHFRSFSRVASESFVGRAIGEWAPDLIVPCDDFAVRTLHELHARAVRRAGPTLEAVRTIIERSLGDPASFSIARKKSALIAQAKAQGILVPETTFVCRPEEFEAQLAAMPYPIVVKVDGPSSWAGTGVRIAKSAAGARSAHRELRAIDNWLWTLRPTLKTLSLRPLAYRRFDGPPTMSLQRYIRGVPANRATLCWQGEVLAGLSVEAVETNRETGFATVVRVVDLPEMTETARVLARTLGLSGFIGFDFIIDAATGRAVLLEMNPRPTQTCHLSFDDQSDMTGALFEQVSGMARTRLEAAPAPSVIALFPGESKRDPQSPHLSSSYHDVPWDEPELVFAYGGAVRPRPSA